MRMVGKGGLTWDLGDCTVSIVCNAIRLAHK
jgi:hypothetical protein